MKTNPNDPAGVGINRNEWGSASEGLSKREYFAAMTIQGLADRNGLTYSDKAGQAVMMADELIQALNRTASDNV